MASSAPQTRAALAAIASMTGCTSVGELEITRRTSAVAVCWPSVSIRAALRASSSLKSRTFSMAITAWSAKVFRSATCLSVKGATSVRRIVMTPMATPSRTSGTARLVRTPVP